MNFIVNNWHIITTIAAALPVGSVIGAKMQRAKTRGQELANLEKARSIEAKLMQDMNDSVDRLTAQNKELRQLLAENDIFIRRCKRTCESPNP